MSEIGASALWGTPVVGGSAVSTMPAAAAPAVTTPDQARDAIAALKQNPEFVKRLYARDAGAKKEWGDLHEIASRPVGPVIDGNNPALSERVINSVAEFAGLGAEVEAQMRAGTPVSADEFRRAVHMREQLVRDEGFRQRYLSGDRAARQQMALLSVVLSSKVTL